MIRRGLIGPALMVALTSCAAPDLLQVSPINTCVAAFECGPGATCVDGMCISNQMPTMSDLLLEITPPPAARLARTQFLDVATDEPGTFLAEIPIPREFPYTVGDGQGNLIDARITVSAEDRIPGRNVEVSQTFTARRQGTLRLNDGTYTVRFQPLGEQLPGVDIKNWQVRESTTGKDFELPGNYRRLEGTVVSRTDSNVWIPNVAVRAVAIPSGLPSSTATSNDVGAFEILLPDTDDTTFQLHAEPLGGNAAWRYEQVISVQPGESRSISIGLRGTDPAATGAAPVRVLGVSDNGPTPVAGAVVTLTASTSIANSSFEIQGVTNAAGDLVLQTREGEKPLLVVAATYRAVVEPDTSSRFARTETSVDLRLIGAAPIVRQISLESRVQVFGDVVTDTGRPVPGVSVEIEPAAGGRVRQEITDNNGEYSVWLDPGLYVVRANTSGVIGQRLPVGFATIEIPDSSLAHRAETIRLARSAAFTGQVTAGGAPLADSDVEAFVFRDGRTVSLGRTQSDAEGNFGLIVPAAP